MKDERSPECAMCPFKDRICQSKEGKAPESCPTINYREVISKAEKEYEKPEIHEFARMASIQESECYSNRHIQPYVLHPVKPRVQEICEFAQKMGYRKLGIAFCTGLRPEAKALTRILDAQGFEVVSVVCKAGATPKEVIGIREEEKIRIGQFESMCSPIVQAAILNEEKTDLNILVGLCVGHDSLFFKYSNAFCTVLIAKDRVLGHNPAGALYTSGTYYARMLRKGF
ncbi:MAG: DUF1847 domain-containing protein [Deltaproteobacteria bacterium]|nr:DUF1847 domain-containing protein [Deltaproteobacteria bacterium]OQX64992.1 MAG: metal-binding protein [Desulfococcus sp. 4484_242]